MYPECADWRPWLKFDSEAEACIHPVMRGRLAAVARDILKRPLDVIAGFRSYEEQLRLYNLWLAGKGNPAAKPGTSWHEFGFAVDARGPQSNWPELMQDYIKPPTGQRLNVYGLCLPLWAGASTHEWWHIQPIETLGYTGDKSAFRLGGETMQRGDNSPAVGAWQNGLDELGYWPATVAKNTNFGPTTEAVTNKFKAANGLPQDGIVDAATWGKMLDALRAHAAKDVSACEAIKTAQAAQLVRLTSDLNTAKAKISAVANIVGQ